MALSIEHSSAKLLLKRGAKFCALGCGDGNVLSEKENPDLPLGAEPSGSVDFKWALIGVSFVVGMAALGDVVPTAGSEYIIAIRCNNRA